MHFTVTAAEAEIQGAVLHDKGKMQRAAGEEMQEGRC